LYDPRRLTDSFVSLSLRAMAVSNEHFLEAMKAITDQMKVITDQIKEIKSSAGEEPPGLEVKKKKEVKEEEQRIDIKHMKMNSFNGTAESYEDWAFSFKRGIRSRNKKAYEMMIKSEEMTDLIIDENDLDPDTDFPGIDDRSAEVYDILCQHLTGEPMLILRSVKDMHGFAAWQRLFRKYNPRTMARGLRMLTEVIQPPRVKNLSDIEGGIIKWEEKAKGLASQFKEELSNGMKLAIFTSMLPDEMQDFVYTHADQKTQYEDLREKVRAMTSNKVANLGRTPVDQVEEEEVWYEGDEEEIDAVSGHVQCHSCGQWGHFARECPWSKGKGKGKGKGVPYGGGGKGATYGGGKGAPFGEGKGGKNGQWTPYAAGKGGKGGGKNGKAFPGACYLCGQWGHKAADCTKAAAPVHNVQTEHVDVGGCWEIAAVDVNDEIAFPPLRRTPVITMNKFLPLADLSIPASDDDSEQALHDQHAPTLHHLRVPIPDQPRGAGAGATGSKDPSIQGQAIHDQHVPTLHHLRVPIPDRPRGADAGATGSKDPSIPGKGKKNKNKKTKKEEENIDICPVEAKVAAYHTRPSSMQFHVADVTKPLAAAAKVVEKGNRIVLDAKGSYIEHAASGERMQLYVKKGVYVFDVTYEDGEQGTITLDSGAGVNVWPKDLKPNIKTEAKKEGLNMFAANGTRIEHVGTKNVRFKGIAAPFPRQSP
jgi:hypothetical protein